jgi:hypothetical protein
MIWHELRTLKRIQWAALCGTIVTLLGIVGILLKFHLHLWIDRRADTSPISERK